MAFLRHANNSINLDHYDMKRRYSPRAVLSQIVVTIHGPLGKNSIYAPRSRARNLSKKQFFPFTQRPCFRDVPLLANEQNNFTNFTHNKNICLSLQNNFGLESWYLPWIPEFSHLSTCCWLWDHLWQILTEIHQGCQVSDVKPWMWRPIEATSGELGLTFQQILKRKCPGIPRIFRKIITSIICFTSDGILWITSMTWASVNSISESSTASKMEDREVGGRKSYGWFDDVSWSMLFAKVILGMFICIFFVKLWFHDVLWLISLWESFRACSEHSFVLHIHFAASSIKFLTFPSCTWKGVVAPASTPHPNLRSQATRSPGQKIAVPDSSRGVFGRKVLGKYSCLGRWLLWCSTVHYIFQLDRLELC